MLVKKARPKKKRKIYFLSFAECSVLQEKIIQENVEEWQNGEVLNKEESGWRDRIMPIITYTCMRNLYLKAKVETVEFWKQKYVPHSKKNRMNIFPSFMVVSF